MSAIWIDQLAELKAWAPDEGRALLWRRAPDCPDRLSPATAADLADADALKTPRLAAARLYRRRVLRTLAARALGARAGSLKIERLDTGESRLTAPIRLRTSLAERDGWIVAGVCAHAIGVDVEVAEPQAPLPLDLLSADQQQRVLAAPQRRARLRVRKNLDRDRGRRQGVRLPLRQDARRRAEAGPKRPYPTRELSVRPQLRLNSSPCARSAVGLWAKD